MSLLILSALAFAAIWTALAVAPQADAAANRRVCKYTSAQTLGNPEHRKVILAMNYKKDGGCPAIDHDRVQVPQGGVVSWQPGELFWEREPGLRKDTCSRFDELTHLFQETDEQETCQFMVKDHLYAVVYGPYYGDLAIDKIFVDLGHVSDLQ